MFDAARLERLDVRSCDVLPKADEAAKQDADMTRLERNPLIAFVALGDRPAARKGLLAVSAPVGSRGAVEEELEAFALLLGAERVGLLGSHGGGEECEDTEGDNGASGARCGWLD